MLVNGALTAGVGLLVSLFPLPLLAHQVQIQGEIGATLHIEPDDIPLAGTPTDVWFALTQPGGNVVPLDDCDCVLTLYDSQGAALAQPDLFPQTAEGYADIPGAAVTFPAVGAYELVLTGSPQGSLSFDPFELRFDVTVAGRAPQSASATNSESDPREQTEVTSPATPDIANVPASEPSANSEFSETATAASSSFAMGRAVGVGGVALVGIILLGIVGKRRSPGGKP